MTTETKLIADFLAGVGFDTDDDMVVLGHLNRWRSWRVKKS